MKQDIKNIEMDSTMSSEASTGVGLGSGTFARPPPMSTRWRDPSIPRKLELKGWNAGSPNVDRLGPKERRLRTVAKENIGKFVVRAR